MPFLSSTSHLYKEPGAVVVIGAGKMGKNHLAALSRGRFWRLIGVYDRHPCKMEVANDDLAGWLEERHPDAAIVAVPPEAHEEVARSCLAAHCHVLLEKPLCPSAQAAAALARDFAGADRVLFGGHTERFNPVFRALNAHTERIGPLRSIRAWRVGPTPDRIDTGGVVLDLAIHDLDLVQRLARERMESIGSACVKQAGEVVEVRASLSAKDVSVEVFAKWDEPRCRGIRLEGTRGSMEADLLERSLVLRTENVESKIDIDWTDPLEAEHEAFASACAGSFDFVADLESQIRAIELAESILSAAV